MNERTGNRRLRGILFFVGQVVYFAWVLEILGFSVTGGDRDESAFPWRAGALFLIAVVITYFATTLEKGAPRE